MRKLILHSFAALGVALAGSSLVASAQSYKVSNLISDGSVPAPVTDPNFLNPWAMSASPTWWISTANTGFNYVVPPAGTVSFKVIVPPASGLATASGLPAGSVTTTGASGMVLTNGTKASFIFSTLDGTISGWNSRLGTANAICQIMINNGAAGASYPGLAILNVNATTSYILAPNFGTGNAVEVYDSNFKATKLAGAFTDPSLPPNYAPYSIHVVGTQVFVNYALRTSAAPYRTVNGAGNGIVSSFDTSGNFVARVVTGGNLNAPWGLAIAPASFGLFSGDLLIGNFGDGKINAYDPKTFAYLGQLVDATGRALTYESLWELLPGGTTVGNTTTVSGGDTSTVYFTAGLANEAHGLLAGITYGTTTGSTPAFGFSTSSGAATITAGNSAQSTFSLAPVGGFSGSVALTCSGLPTGATCNFSPTAVTVSPTAVTTGTVDILTTKTTASLAPLLFKGHETAGLTTAILCPALSLLLFRRRRPLRGQAEGLRLLGVLFASAMFVGLLAGCADSLPATPATPAGQSTITITATSGTLSQTSTMALTVQ